MSLNVLVAGTGERLTANPVVFSSLDAFKAWLATAVGVAANEQILLTKNGKQVKLGALLSENEIYVYNRRVITGSKRSSDATLTPATAPSLPPSDSIPDTVLDQSSLQAWQQLFKSRRAWAAGMVDKARLVVKEIQKQTDAHNIIERGLDVALGNLISHVRTLEQRNDEAKGWSTQVVQDQKSMLDALETTSRQLRTLPADRRFLRFLPKLANEHLSQSDAGQSDADEAEDYMVSLIDFLDDAKVKGASRTVSSTQKNVADLVSQIGAQVQEVSTNAHDLAEDVESERVRSAVNAENEASQLVEEVEVLAKKVSADYEHTMTLLNNPKSVSQVSKMALQHSRNHLPSIKECFTEMGPVLQRAVDQRQTAAMNALDMMRRIAGVEASLSQVNAKVMALDVPEESAAATDMVSLTCQLPFVYGALLIEAVRRHEWAEKIKGESAALAEEIAGYREEEERRRKKWLKNMGDLVEESLVAGDALKFELNLQSEEHEWPEVTRNEISTYLQALRQLENVQEIIEELSEAAKDLDRPTKRQVRKAKAFKMGSIHDADMKGSFFLRDNDEAKALRESNNKLEEELKAQKSRVRKLEDLLYKQGQLARTPTGNLFQPSPENLSPDATTPTEASPRAQNQLIRQASTNSRRASINSTEERNLARRIVTLEAELQEERKKRQDVEKQADTTKLNENKLNAEIEESRSTKNDLMENMEAQQREFANERRSLEQEVTKYKNRIEEVEDELDRMLGSRENERVGADERLRLVEQQVLNAKTAATRREEDERECTEALQGIHSALAPTKEVPSTLKDLLQAVEGLAEKTTNQAQELHQSLAATRTEKEASEAALHKQESDYGILKSQLAALETAHAISKDESAAGEAKASSLATELEDARTQLRNLRAKFAEGETGSESLRQRLEEQAARASSLATQLAEAKSHVNSLDVELSSLQRKHASLQSSHDAALARLETRAVRDRDLTSRLVSRGEDLARLLEKLGLSMIRSDGQMTVVRTSKLTGASSTLPDPSTSNLLNLTGSTATTAVTTAVDIAADSPLLQWMHANNAEEETRLFTQLMAKFDEFSISAFCEGVMQLRKYLERAGSKYKNESRAFRDRYARAQSEAHEKIAFRSFKEGDLALFLPTRNQATKPWAAFNMGAPHYFLRELDSHRLRNREWLVARITKIQERVVDLSKSMSSAKAADGRSIGEASEGAASIEDDNPFDLSDGLRWYLLDAAEDKPGAPTTPGLAKSTVASANVDAKGDVGMLKKPAGKDASAKLNKSLESRRSSSNSKRNSISGPSGRDAHPQAELAVGSPVVPSAGQPVSGTQSASATPTDTHLKPGAGHSLRQAPATLASQQAPGTWDPIWSVDVSMEASPSKKK